MTDAQLDGAVALLDRMIEASEADDTEALVTVSREFVIYVISHSGNTDLVRVLGNENVVIERNLRHAPLDVETPEQRHGGYRRLRMALLARDADEAERWFRVQCRLLGAAGVGVAAPSAAA